MCVAQVGIGTTTPSPASALDVNSSLDGGTTFKGLMPPRVPNESARNTINPAPSDIGLLIFLESLQCLQIWNGTAWESFYCLGTAPPSSLLGSQDFEISPATPTLNYTVTGSGAVITESAVGGFTPSGTLFPSGTQAFATNDGTDVLLFDTVDASSFTSVTLSFKLASLSTTGGNGSDAVDEVLIEISTDGGTTWSRELEIEGFNNARWNFAGTGSRTTVYDGDNTQTIFNASPGANLTGTDTLTNISISGIPNSPFITVRITLNNNSANEYWLIDDVVLTGI